MAKARMSFTGRTTEVDRSPALDMNARTVGAPANSLDNAIGRGRLAAQTGGQKVEFTLRFLAQLIFVNDAEVFGQPPAGQEDREHRRGGNDELSVDKAV